MNLAALALALPRDVVHEVSPGAARPGEGPVVRRVYLDEPPARARSSSGDPGGAVEGRLGLEVPVRGHLKRQPYGPAQSLRRWVYVESYEARRWIAPRPLRLVVREGPGT